VLVAKYADHPPLYRQAQIYARQGVTLDRSTLAGWVGRAAFLLHPVYEELFSQLKHSERLFADETTARVLDPGRGRTIGRIVLAPGSKRGEIHATLHGELGTIIEWVARTKPVPKGTKACATTEFPGLSVSVDARA